MNWGSAQLIGGYNPLDWSGNCGWKSTKDSFLFNITDGKNISTAKLGYVNEENYAVYCRNYRGPKMGDFSFSDSNNLTYNTSGTRYPNIGIPARFVVESYEVFQVIKQ